MTESSKFFKMYKYGERSCKRYLIISSSKKKKLIILCQDQLCKQNANIISYL